MTSLTPPGPPHDLAWHPGPPPLGHRGRYDLLLPNGPLFTYRIFCEIDENGEVGMPIAAPQRVRRQMAESAIAHFPIPKVPERYRA